MGVAIGQRELRNDNAEIIRRVEAGETFTITRHGVPVADLVPHVRGEPTGGARLLGEVQHEYRDARQINVRAWRAERESDDDVFGPDDPLTDEWSRRAGAQASDS